MSEDEDWTCPSCGLPDEELPAGHWLSIPFDGSDPACVVAPDPPPIEEFLAAAGKPARLGEFLHNLLNPEPSPGPPFTHTLKAPEPIGELEDGTLIYPEPGSAYTLTEDS